MIVISSDFPDTGLGLDYNYDDGFTLNGVCDSFCQVERNEEIVCENSEPWTEGARLRSCLQLIIFKQEARAQATEFEKNVREFEAQFGGETIVKS